MREASVHTLGIYTATDRCFTCKTRVVSDVGAYSSAPPIYCTPDKLRASSYVLKNKAFKTVQKRPQNRGHIARCPCPLRASVISHYYHQALP